MRVWVSAYMAFTGWIKCWCVCYFTIGSCTPDESSKTFILDVRDETEFAEGHIQGAKHMPLAKLEERIQELAKQKTKAVLVVCQRGVRSNAACKILTANQFTQVYSLQGGLDKWIEAKMPLVKDE